MTAVPEPRARMSELFRSDNLLVRQYAGFGSDICVVTLPNYAHRPSREGTGFGSGFLEGLGYDSIRLTCAINGWFQYPEMEEAASVIRQAGRRYREVVTYGSSMGGYGALLLARRVGACRVVAYAPQVTIDPGRPPYEKRWQADAAGIEFQRDDVLDQLSAGIDIYIVFDPLSADINHVRLLRTGMARLHERPFPFAGHAVANALRHTGHLKAVTAGMLRGDLSGRDWQAERRQSRSASPVVLRAMTMRLLERRWHRSAQAVIDRAYAVTPNDIETLIIAATVQRRNKRYQQALQTLGHILAMDPNQLDRIRVALADTKRVLGL